MWGSLRPRHNSVFQSYLSLAESVTQIRLPASVLLNTWHRKSGGDQAVPPWFRGNEFSMWDAAQFVQQVIYCRSAPEGLMWVEDNEMKCKADKQMMAETYIEEGVSVVLWLDWLVNLTGTKGKVNVTPMPMSKDGIKQVVYLQSRR
ncbi:hypothetical protein DPX16_12803 [Anabarilius grahami]|uniref:Uncharacterized protein n=1 Tax=Anabarilius grahami TaxID=495550 RepID=A0A3N0Z9J9_ANAGA|nr:hypothetical protein DPX16_12803 [Anabarilius grahami]